MKAVDLILEISGEWARLDEREGPVVIRIDNRDYEVSNVTAEGNLIIVHGIGSTNADSETEAPNSSTVG